MTRIPPRNPTADLTTTTRRETLAAFAAGAAALCLPGFSNGRDCTDADVADPQLTAHARDWAWLVGTWDVRHERLKDRLAGSAHWEQFSGKSAMRLVMGGFGTVDDNALDLPGGAYGGAGIRAFNPATRQWSIWWLDSRHPTKLDPPVVGGFEGETGTFTGRDTLRDRPIIVRFRWRDVHGSRPWWEQAFSADDGASWEVNWRNYFTRTAKSPSVLSPTEAAPSTTPGDWEFLIGRWTVQHQRLRRRLAGDTDWERFAGTLVNWPMLGGQGNISENVMAYPAGTYRGLGIRAFDPQTRHWSSWWLDGRTPAAIAPPVLGRFANGVGVFIGDDEHEGRPIKARVQWSRITRTSARWEQAFSADGGASWETNWISDFSRAT